MDRSANFTAGDVLRALGAIVALGGYVLLVGAIVAWLDVGRLGVPATSVVADMPRNELLGLGLETLAIWVALGVVFTLLLAGAGSAAGEDPVPVFAAFAAGAVFAGGAFAIGWISLLGVEIYAWFAWSALLGGFVWIFREDLQELVRTGGRALWGPLASLAAGLALGVALGVLVIEPGSFPGGFLTAFGSLAAGMWAAGEIVWRRKERETLADAEKEARDAEEASRVQAEQDPDTLRDEEAAARRRNARQVLAEERAATAGKLRASVWRSAAAIVVLAAFLGWGAILARTSHDFWRARVTMTNGTCVAGTLLVRDSDEVLLAGAGKPQQPVRMIEVPASIISSVQVIGPAGHPHELRAETCAQAAKTRPGTRDPYPLVSSGAEVNPVSTGDGGGTPIPGPEGKQGREGKAGAEGREGHEGKPGHEGKEGHVGKAGPEGHEGKEGKEGPEGKKGAQGQRGLEGKEGSRGATGSRGEKGATGPQGPQGTRGPQGEPGPRGVPGRSADEDDG